MCLLAGAFLCNKKVDVVVAIDRSMPNRSDWNYALQYLANISGRFEVGTDKVHVGVVTFSARADVEFYLNNYTDQSSLAGAIGRINYQTGRGDFSFANAFNRVRNEVFMPANGARTDACKVLVMVAFCDGSQRDNWMTLSAASAAKAAGVKTITVGSTSMCSRHQLRQMAYTSTKNTVFWFASPGGMWNTTNAVATGTCALC